MADRARFEELLHVLAELRAANRESPVLVEGTNDVRTLRALGLDGIVVPLHDGRTLHDACEALAREHRCVILLTDWDRKGGFLRAEATRVIEAAGARVETDFRARVKALLDEPIGDVESLFSYVSRGLDLLFHETIEEHLARGDHAHTA